MTRGKRLFLYVSLLFVLFGCGQSSKTAEEILGNPDYLAFSYGGYRENTRDEVPTVDELKDDMKILSRMGVKILRTYNTSQYAHAKNLLAAIHELKDEDPTFEMYVMLGTWIESKGAWTDTPDPSKGNLENNTQEIDAAIAMANKYPDIVKSIAVGNEAMVQWAVTYFVMPKVILKWVNHLQDAKASGDLPADIWITSSDNFESWGGGAKNYHTEDLTALLRAVDFVSLHTYPFHDTHYNPQFWGIPKEQEGLSEMEQINAAVERSVAYAQTQYQNTASFIKSLGIDKPIHIGEIGWASIDSSHYGPGEAKAADEYKQKLFYEQVREWTNSAGLSCFYFEAFDEQWKDKKNSLGSENHFGMINLKNEAKYTLWSDVDAGLFDGLTRNGKAITKTYAGDKQAMLKDVLRPPLKSEMGILEITTINASITSGEPVSEESYILVHETMTPDDANKMTYPSSPSKLNAWEGTSSIKMSDGGVIEVITGKGDWWGAAVEIRGGVGENLSQFIDGYLHFDIRGDTSSNFKIGFQTGFFAEGTQVNNFVSFAPVSGRMLSTEWVSYSVPISELNNGADLSNVTGALFLRSDEKSDGKYIFVKNIYYSK